MAYNRMNAVAYAHRWAFARNPMYMNFTGIGGDCTNFISQCILAGGAPMNYEKTFGWYYNSSKDRAPAWTGARYLYNFLTKSKEIGPSAKEIALEELEIGDIVQITFDGIVFTHSLLVVEVPAKPTLDTILIATHTNDSDHRALSTYHVVRFRYLKVNLL
ncbi:amidase domain-containing protein [Lachnospiraceae bacterium ZAX-1]